MATNEAAVPAVLAETAAPAVPVHPPGDYAIVELFGHSTLVGRIEECERFGSKMLAIEPIFKGQLLPAVLRGGAAIYGLTPCTPETAFRMAPTNKYSLPDSVRSIVPPLLLEAGGIVDGGGDDDPF